MAGITNGERYNLKRYILHTLGYPQIEVELTYSGYSYPEIAISGVGTDEYYTGTTGTESQIDYAIDESVEEMSSILTRWAINNHIGNTLGLPSDQDFTLRWVAQDFGFNLTFASAYSEQVGLRGSTDMNKDFITLSAGVQTYDIAPNRKVNEVIWHMQNQIVHSVGNAIGTGAWTNQEFGWDYMGYPVSYVRPIWHTVLAAQMMEVSKRVLLSDFSMKIIHNQLTLYPCPQQADAGDLLWYFYYDTADLNRYSGQTKNSLVSNPGTVTMNQIQYDEMNSYSQHWIKAHSLALSKQILGRIRSKFSSIKIPDDEVTMDGEILLSEGIDEQQTMRADLIEMLDSLNLGTLLEGSADDAENLHRQLQFIPTQIFTSGNL
jgi:hypothetical protein